MSEEFQDRASDKLRPRLKVLAAGMGAVVAELIVALSGVASAGIATPTVFAGAHYVGNHSITKDGCATQKTATPKWSKLTGAGKISSATGVTTCPKSKGGPSFQSVSESEPQLSVFAPVKVRPGVGGVNVSWTITLAGSLTLSAPAKAKCAPTVYTSNNYYASWYNSTSGSTVSTWDNYTQLFTDCVVENEVWIIGNAYLLNLSGGPTISASNSWSGPMNYSYDQIYGSSSWQNFSNPAASPNSFSYAPVTTTTAGFSPQNFTGTYAPQWFLNTSSASTAFWAKSSYEVYTYIEADVFAIIVGYPHASATAMVNMSTGSNHVRLLPLVVW
jgi:hypothetical protein